MMKKATTGLIIALFTVLALFPSQTEAQSRKQKKRARNLITQGDRLYRQKDYKAAVMKYAEGLSIVPKQPLAHYKKAVSHFNLKKFDEAIVEFTISLVQGYDRGRIYSFRWRAYFAKKNLALAMRDVQQGKRLAPNNAYFYIAEGQVFHGQKRYRDAIDSYNIALARGSANKNIQYLIAVSYSRMGDRERQAEFANKALKAGTKYQAMAWFLLGDAQQRLRRYEDAVSSYQNCLRTSRRLYGVYVNLAETYRVLNRVNEAIDTANAGMKIFPKDPTLRVNLSWYYSLSDKNSEAILYAKEAVRLAPKQYLGYTNLCRAYNDTGQYDLALENCRTALRLHPGDGETYFYLGRNYQLRNDTGKAFENYRKAVKGLVSFAAKNPNYADGFYLLGNAYSVTDNRRKAIGAYRKSLEIAPLFARARFNLGIVYLRDGNVAAARRQRDALRSIDTRLAKKLGEAIDR